MNFKTNTFKSAKVKQENTNRCFLYVSYILMVYVFKRQMKRHMKAWDRLTLYSRHVIPASVKMDSIKCTTFCESHEGLGQTNTVFKTCYPCVCKDGQY